MTSYITYEQLYQDVLLFLRKIPRSVILDIAGVLGVPRSGMLPATMIANHLHLPVVDSYSFVRFNYRFSISGQRMPNDICQGNTILVVDDSVYTGNSMERAMGVLCDNSPGHLRYTTGAIYRDPANQPTICYHAKDVAKPRYFEWNLIQHPDMPHFMLDMDGILCYDPPVKDNDDINYVWAIKDAEPLYLPRHRVGSICTMRLEKHRLITENWLAKHGVTYDQLLMPDIPTSEERRRTLKYGEWKGERYRESDRTLFIESDSTQAPIINYTSKKPVICPIVGKVYQNNLMPYELK